MNGEFIAWRETVTPSPNGSRFGGREVGASSSVAGLRQSVDTGTGRWLRRIPFRMLGRYCFDTVMDVGQDADQAGANSCNGPGRLVAVSENLDLFWVAESKWFC